MSTDTCCTIVSKWATTLRTGARIFLFYGYRFQFKRSCIKCDPVFIAFDATYFLEYLFQVFSVIADSISQQIDVNSGTSLESIQCKQQRTALQQKMAFVRTCGDTKQQAFTASILPTPSCTLVSLLWQGSVSVS